MTQQNPYYTPATNLSPDEVAAFNERLSVLGVDAGVAKALILDTLDVMVQMTFTVTDSLWRTKSENDVFMRTVLTDATGQSREWDSETYKGQSILAFVRGVNAAAHCTERTSGAKRFFDTVTYSQGGEYCALCGDCDDLEVDHISPVSAGGSRDALANLQLLCSVCNGGKHALKSRLLPVLLKSCTTDCISTAVRFKCLLLAARTIDGRPHSCCSVCGCNSSTCKIIVECRSTSLTASIFNVHAKCTKCR